jgi:tetratricopeptide (TPR) repeat protein
MGQLRVAAGLSILMAVLTVAGMGRVCADKFVDFDDDRYVALNPHVQDGVSIAGTSWAITSMDESNWHPVTWLSLQLDGSLYGARAWGYHLTNLLLHAASAILLFRVLLAMTGAVWCAWLVAALFAVHPVHVESVVWIAERKDVLSAFFWMLTLLAYWRYTQALGRGRLGSALTVYALLVLPLFGMGLLAKPMLVTLPLVLLLLDYWPLGRLGDGQSVRAAQGVPWRLLLEKLPLFSLAVASAVITLMAQDRGGAVISVERLTIGVRLANAAVSYVRYVGKAFWPQRLAAFYPYPAPSVLGWSAVGAAGLLALATVIVLRRRRHQPYLAVGWLWYMGTLVPVIGLVQVGHQALADRYTYIPLIGLFIMLAWVLGDGVAQQPGWRLPVAAMSGAMLAACLAGSWVQAGYWKGGETLWRHALEVLQESDTAHNGLGVALLERGQTEEAIAHFREAVRLNPRMAEARNNLGGTLARTGQIEEGIAHLEQAVLINSHYVKARVNLGNAFLKSGQVDEAVRQFLIARETQPELAAVYLYLGEALTRQGRLREGEQQLRELLRKQPSNANGYHNLALNLKMQGNVTDAVQYYKEALRLDPGHAEAHVNLGAILAVHGKLAEAEDHFREAVRIAPSDDDGWYNLGLALDMAGKVEEAAAKFQRAINLRPRNAAYHYNLAFALAEQGKVDEAAAEYRAGEQINPGWPKAALERAWVLATHPSAQVRNGTLALRLARQACQATGEGEPGCLATLGAAYAEVGRFDLALSAAQKALARAVNQPEEVRRLQEQSRLYAKGLPMRDAAESGRP